MADQDDDDYGNIKLAAGYGGDNSTFWRTWPTRR